MSVRATVHAALVTAITAKVGAATMPAGWPAGAAAVADEDPEPERVPVQGQVIVELGRLVPLREELSGPYTITHRIPVKVYCMHKDKALRDAARDVLAAAVSAAIDDDGTTLAGLVGERYIETADFDNLGLFGSEVNAAANIIVALTYHAATPLG